MGFHAWWVRREEDDWRVAAQLGRAWFEDLNDNSKAAVRDSGRGPQPLIADQRTVPLTQAPAGQALARGA